MEKTQDEVMAAAFTLLLMKGIITMQEFDEAQKDGYDGIWSLLNDKFRKIQGDNTKHH